MVLSVNFDRSSEEKAVIKGSWYLLLSAFENIRLKALLAVNDTLHKAYLLKEDLRLFCGKDSRDKVQAFIETWPKKAYSVGNSHLDKMTKTIENHLQGILNYYDYPITTGPLEGINNKIKVLKRAAYGFRDTAYFKLRILFARDATFALVGS